MIRLDFPGYTGADSLEHISWDDWFDKFDESGLALLHQETTARGTEEQLQQAGRARNSSSTRPRQQQGEQKIVEPKGGVAASSNQQNRNGAIT